MPREYGNGLKDANQAYIERRLSELYGVSVKSLAERSGQLDLLVGYLDRTHWYELKRPGCRKDLSAKEVEILDTWKGHVKVVEFFSEIIRDIGYPLDDWILAEADAYEWEHFGKTKPPASPRAVANPRGRGLSGSRGVS